jgi:L-ascorbate metabolism protein UlaG (beta-lactamase superfamily)
MPNEPLYRLSESAAVEPLVNRWVAWSHVVAPVASSLHLMNYQIALLRSYLKDPKTHYQACKNPKLRSGHFVEIPQERAAEVRDFLTNTEVKQHNNLKLAKSIIEFHNFLVKEAKGLSLEPYYEKLPQELRGYVELVYDYYNRPTLRCVEGLLYESDYYNKSLQSFRLFQQKLDNSRSFFMNTPRLPEKDQLDWQVPFDDPLVDELFKLDSYPKPLAHIRSLLRLSEAQDSLLLPLLSQGPIPPRPQIDDSRIHVTYFGHATILVEWNGVKILTDPCIGLIPSEGGVDRYTYSNLPERIDYVIVTHNHHDHFCFESLLRLRHRIGCLVVPRSYGIAYGDLSLRQLASNSGFKNVIELDSLDAIPIPDGEIITIPFMGEHADLPHGKTAYVIRAGRHKMLFAADSDCLDRVMYQHIRSVLGPIQTVFLGMECVGAPLSWSCGSFLPEKPERKINQSRRYKGCDSARGMTILETIGAERIYLYAMGLEPWLEHFLGLAYTDDALQITEARKLLADARARGFLEAKLLYAKGDITLDSYSQKSSPDQQPAGAISARRSHQASSLSSAQRRMLDLESSEQAPSRFNIPIALHLRGALNLPALEQSMAEIIRRHDALRLSVAKNSAGFADAMISDSGLTLQLIDLSALSESVRETRIPRIVSAEAGRQFDLTRSPIRASLLTVGESEQILLIVIHRIAGDNESCRLLFEELTLFYNCYADGKPSPLPDIALRHDRHAGSNQRANLFEKQTSYWKQKLAGVEFNLDLPTDRPRSVVQTYRGATISLALAPETAEALKALSIREGVTDFVTALAAFQALLHRYTGKDVIVVGSAFDTRTEPETQKVIGALTNTVALIADLSSNPSFTDLIGQARVATLEAQVNKDVPLEAVLESLPQEGATTDKQAIQAWIATQSPLSPSAQLRGVTAIPMPIDLMTARCDLALLLIDGVEEFVISLNYSSELFDAETANEILEHYRAVIEHVSAHPECRVLDIPLVEQGEEALAAAESNFLAADGSEDRFLFD